MVIGKFSKADGSDFSSIMADSFWDGNWGGKLERGRERKGWTTWAHFTVNVMYDIKALKSFKKKNVGSIDLQLQSWDNTHLTFRGTPGWGAENILQQLRLLFVNGMQKMMSILKKCYINRNLKQLFSLRAIGHYGHVAPTPSTPPLFTDLIISNKNVISMMQRQANLLICLSRKKLCRTSLDVFAVNISQVTPQDSLSEIHTSRFFQTT